MSNRPTPQRYVFDAWYEAPFELTADEMLQYVGKGTLTMRIEEAMSNLVREFHPGHISPVRFYASWDADKYLCAFDAIGARPGASAFPLNDRWNLSNPFLHPLLVTRDPLRERPSPWIRMTLVESGPVAELQQRFAASHAENQG